MVQRLQLSDAQIAQVIELQKMVLAKLEGCAPLLVLNTPEQQACQCASQIPM